ncbi:DUF4307 domain-containing protein [Mumia zhuanghuii]|uniref:DUF4307 domain-containing protein n=1 Tax=Mumia zhuanghuii TaxID=2585211 RepID=A0A5C4N3V9_9ACTN|nr:DUF4307 domain-containing protein [Mumia zhuanghuii]TNC48111.1 DUF4307 domain-containing protein [Mumia zhuanghuii]TNC50932.1 DUF4307 domain-containing protein [Mumia zhuanghuii]
MPTTEPDLTASRYGRRRQGLSRRTWTVIAVVGVTLGVIATWIVAQQQTKDSFQADVVAFDVLSDHQTSVTLRVFHSSGKPAECDVAAQAQDRTYVGEKTIPIPRTAKGDTAVSDVITTERRAVTAIIVDCRLTG